MILTATMLFFLAFNWNISIGSMVAMVGSILAVAVMLKSGGPWKSVAEGLQAKNVLLEEQNRLLKAENEALSKKTDVQGVMALVGQVAGSVAAMAKHVGDLGHLVNGISSSLEQGRAELDESRKDASNVATAITTTLQQFGVILKDLQQEMADHREEALERRAQWQAQHEAIMEELRRPPTARTRQTDVRDGA